MIIKTIKTQTNLTITQRQLKNRILIEVVKNK